MYASKAASRPGRPPLARGRDSWGHALRLSQEEREWEGILLHLPNNVRQLWRVLHACGGQDLRVPRQEPKRDSPLRRLGLRCLRKLMAAFGGTRVYVPRCNALLGKLRQREIIEGFSRHTGHGLSSTAAVAALAQRHDMSDRRIWQLLKKEASAPARVLYRLGDSAALAETGADAQGAAVALTALKIPGRMEPMPLRVPATEAFSAEEVQSLAFSLEEADTPDSASDSWSAVPGAVWTAAGAQLALGARMEPRFLPHGVRKPWLRLNFTHTLQRKKRERRQALRGPAARGGYAV